MAAENTTGSVAAVQGGSLVAAEGPYSIWGPTDTPAVISESDTDSLELGVRFRANTAGRITGVRFYKGAGNGGTHTGSVWTTDGIRLATATFTNETAALSAIAGRSWAMACDRSPRPGTGATP